MSQLIITHDIKIKQFGTRFMKLNEKITEVFKNKMSTKDHIISELTKNFNELKLLFGEQQKLLEITYEENKKLSKTVDENNKNNRKSYAEITKQKSENKSIGKSCHCLPKSRTTRHDF